MTNVEIANRLNDYTALVTELNADYWTRNDFTYAPAPTASASIGKRYAKVTTENGLHSFVDMENGDIIKGTWKAPIRTKRGLAVRGNIFADDLGASKITWHGPRYLY